MPAVISWEGVIPNESVIARLREQLQVFTSEETDDFPVAAMYWETHLEREKVIMSENYMFLCTIKENILCLIPDDALDIHKLIWMWDAEPVIVNFLSSENIKQAMTN